MVVCLNSTFEWKNYSNQEQTMVKAVLLMKIEGSPVL